MKLALDITGEKFNRLTAIRKTDERYKGKIIWECLCDCGNTTKVSGSSLKSGNTKSCGCLNIDKIKERSTTHGESKSSMYHIWISIKQRCLNEDNKAYKNYGARGISICDRWINSFECFNSDMGERPSYRHSVDRINNDGNYEPDNCRWATDETQMQNTRLLRSNNKSGYRGVFYHKFKGKWVSEIHHDGKYVSICSVTTPKEAAILRDKYIIDKGLGHKLNFEADHV